MSEIKRHYVLYLFILPAFIGVLLFSYGSMAFIATSFFDYDPIRGLANCDFIGIANYKRAFSDRYFIQALKNTIYIKGFETLITFPMSVILALFLFEMGRRFKKLVQTATFLPYFLSWVVVAAMFKSLLATDGGLVNEIITGVFGHKAIPFLSNNKYFPWVIILQDFWKFGGYFAIIYHSAMIMIDPALYEVATIDGAGRWRQMVSVTLPCIKSTLITMFVLLTGYIVLGPFEQVFAQYSPAVYKAGDIVETYSYRIGLTQYKYGLATAIGVIQSVMATGIVLFANFVVLKKLKSSVL